MQFSMTFALELKFDYAPAEYEMGHLFERERMQLNACNLELTDEQIALFEEKALQEFKAEKANGMAARAYDIYLDSVGAY